MDVVEGTDCRFQNGDISVINIQCACLGFVDSHELCVEKTAMQLSCRQMFTAVAEVYGIQK